MTDGIWIGRAHADSDEVLQTVEELWARAKRGNHSTAGQILTIPDGPAVEGLGRRSTAHLQQLTKACASELRFKTHEVFISAHSDLPWSRSTAHMIGASFRIVDNKYGESQRPEKKPTFDKGAYAISHSHDTVRALRELLVFGEPFSALAQRRTLYFESPEADRSISSYINYKIVGTFMAHVAGVTPEEKRGPGPVLWEIGRNSLHRKEWPRARVRDALKYVIGAYRGRVLLEEKDVGGLDRYRDAAERLVGASSLREEHRDDVIRAMPDAIGLWQEISDSGEKICEAVRAKGDELPSELVHFLFAARPQTYVPWLQSATLEVEGVHKPLVHTDLDRRIADSNELRNKSVDVIAKGAYERAGAGLLGGSLKSMVLAPFSACPGRNLHGFVRFMNRFVGDELYEYGGPSDFEDYQLAEALTKVLSRELSREEDK